MLQLQSQLFNWLKAHPCSAIVIVADNTVWNLYKTWFAELNSFAPVTEIPVQGGEKAKSLDIISMLWQKMLANRIDKEALLINIGGGSISDAGGLAAATYKRGIPYINIPTTLLAMVDAAIGGKTAINFGGIKNSIGTITLPQELFIAPQFLQSLPHKELLSGFAELLKYALIADADLWHALQNLTEINANTISPEWIERAGAFKKKLVTQDLYDRNERRCLNFGHTVGHALETFFSAKTALTHGHAIALGMVAEAWLSHRHGRLSKAEAEAIQQFIARFYSFVKLQNSDIQEITKLCLQDKKNSNGTINCTFLESIGHYSVNNEVDGEDIGIESK
jgi:3-dehydroquinate synthase